MQIKKLIAAVFGIMIGFSACQKDLIVEDITDKTVTPLSPPDGYNTPNNSITFWWEEVDGAEKYNVQIVSPSFSNIQQLITDTSVTTDKFTKVLTPGTYQWRVRGVNNGGETSWTTRTLTIDTSSNLTYSAVILLSPADSFYSNTLSHTFSWTSVNNATNYIFNMAGSLYNYSTTSATFNFQAEGTYIWSVKAENSFSSTPYATRKIIIDQTPPSQTPNLIYPIAISPLVSVDTTMSWSTPSDSYRDVLTISTDANFATATTSYTVSAGSSGIRTFPVSSLSNPSGNTYYWKVKSLDRAGNEGSYSSTKSFSVQ